MPRPALGCGAQSTGKFYFRSSAGSHRWPPSSRRSTLTLDSSEKITSLHARRRGLKSARTKTVSTEAVFSFSGLAPMNVVLSSGHGKYVRGASGYIDEVDEARKVVEAVARYLRMFGVGVETFHDDVSTTQEENLERIVMYHNGRNRDLDISVHFNAYVETENPMGCEVLYATEDELAEDMAALISDAGGFINRGAKERDDLFFLNNTDMPAILIETCFVDSLTDTKMYRAHFEEIC